MQLNSDILLSRSDRSRAAVCALLVPLLLLWSLCIDVIIVHAHAGEPPHVHAGRTLRFDRSLLHAAVDGCHHHHHHCEAEPMPQDVPTQGTSLAAGDCHTTLFAASSQGFVRHEQRSARQLLDQFCAAPLFALDVVPAAPHMAPSAAPMLLNASPPALDVVRCAVRLI